MEVNRVSARWRLLPCVPLSHSRGRRRSCPFLHFLSFLIFFECCKFMDVNIFQMYLSRVSVRGILTNAHNEITRTQVEALNSTL
jgi:hypothetical protein